eukprot:TRINITY_DN13273_c0_g1_i2.p1 TRINITY_DN13273_c0_g1~~TRINITY_DN13273_c0_g1_i2.p1  ORF type:complete len:474 (+),score=55.19 TRINITY_DN13273_c0_g1_i2:210-1631(+)
MAALSLQFHRHHCKHGAARWWLTVFATCIGRSALAVHTGAAASITTVRLGEMLSRRSAELDDVSHERLTTSNFWQTARVPTFFFLGTAAAVMLLAANRGLCCSRRRNEASADQVRGKGHDGQTGDDRDDGTAVASSSLAQSPCSTLSWNSVLCWAAAGVVGLGACVVGLVLYHVLGFEDEVRWLGAAAFEAHSMLCGSPDCSRDAFRCAGQMNATAVMNMSFKPHGDQMPCCRDLMLRMLLDVGAWLDAQNIEWYVTYGTLLGAVRDGAIIRWTDDLDIVIPSMKGVLALRGQTDIPYRFGRYGTLGRGCANYPGVPERLPHHPSGPGARVWVTKWAEPMFVCVGSKCNNRRDPADTPYPVRSRSEVGGSSFLGMTSYYFMDVYTHTESWLQVCNAIDNPSTEKVLIGGHPFPTHHNWEKCLEVWYGKEWRTPKHTDPSDYALLEETQEEDGGNKHTARPRKRTRLSMGGQLK